jgi:hypothetical protein
MMNEKTWRAELDTALAGGLPWRVASAWCHRGSPLCGAEVAHTSTGTVRVISLSTGAFPSAMTRKEEIVRQLTSPRGATSG